MPETIGKKFMDGTKFNEVGPSDQQLNLPAPPIEEDYDIPPQGLISLPEPEKMKMEQFDLTEAISLRESVRDYSEEALSLHELSYLLWCTQGVKQVLKGAVTFRTVPSAGARHAFETYLLVNRVDGLEPGLYRFIATEHKLLRIETGDKVADEITQAALGQQMIANSAVAFLWVAVQYRMNWRYGERGYRYLHLDAGHVCQNLYLAAGAVNCGVCAIAAFDDDRMNLSLGLDGETRFVIYLASLGKRE